MTVVSINRLVVVSLSPANDEMHTIQHYVMKFVGDLRQVDGCLRVLRISPPITLTAISFTLKMSIIDNIK
jgi:hypothetical protein